jgi:hypothetical protein
MGKPTFKANLKKKKIPSSSPEKNKPGKFSTRKP